MKPSRGREKGLKYNTSDDNYVSENKKTLMCKTCRHIKKIVYDRRQKLFPIDKGLEPSTVILLAACP